jgi:hypothetical protein
MFARGNTAERPGAGGLITKIVTDMQKDGTLSKLSLKWLALDMTTN